VLLGVQGRSGLGGEQQKSFDLTAKIAKGAKKERGSEFFLSK